MSLRRFSCFSWSIKTKTKTANKSAQKKGQTQTKEENAHSKDQKTEEKIKKTFEKTQTFEKKADAGSETYQAFETAAKTKATESSKESQTCSGQENTNNEKKNPCQEDETETTILSTASSKTPSENATSKKESHQDAENESEPAHAEIEAIGYEEVGARAENRQVTAPEEVSNDGQATGKAEGTTKANDRISKTKNPSAAEKNLSQRTSDVSKIPGNAAKSGEIKKPAKSDKRPAEKNEGAAFHDQKGAKKGASLRVTKNQLLQAHGATL